MLYKSVHEPNSLESILYIHHLVDPFPKCLAGFMSPKTKDMPV